MEKKIELVRVPLGYSTRAPFAHELEKLPFGEGVLVLPNRLLTDDVQRKYNIETVGLDTLANKLLNLNGYVKFDEISRRSQELIVQDIIDYMVLGEQEKEKSRLHKLDKDKALGYFERLAKKPGFVKAMTSLVSQLARSGATREEISEALTAWAGAEDKYGNKRTGIYLEKDEGVRNVYLLYRQLLANNQWFDLEGKYRLALRILYENKKPHIIWKKVYFSDFYSFDRLQIEFIRALAHYCDIKIGMVYEIGDKEEPMQAEREKYFAATYDSYQGLLTGLSYKYRKQEEKLPEEQRDEIKVEEVSLPAPNADTLAADIRQLRKLGKQVAPVPAENVLLYKFKSREAEMRWVLADVKQKLRSGVAAQDVLVAVRDLSTYSGLRRLADEYGLPVSLPLTSSLAAQPLAKLVRLLLDAVSDTHEGAEAYFALLTSELLPLLVHVDLESVDELRKERYFKQRSIAQQVAHEQLEDDEVWTKFDAFIETLAAADAKRATMAMYTQLLGELLQGLRLEQLLGSAARQGLLPLEAVAACLRSRDAFVKLLQQLAQDYKRCGREQDAISFKDFRQELLEALAQTEIVLKHGRQDGVLLTSVVNVPGLSFDYVYIMGLRDSEFPQAKNENWIYNDKERSELAAGDIHLPTTAQSYAEDACFFAQTLTAAQKKLYLSWTEEAEHDESVYVSTVQKLFTNLEVQSPPEQPCASPEEAERRQGTSIVRRLHCLAEREKELAGAKWLKQQIGTETVAAAQADAERYEQAEGVFNGVLADAELKQRVTKKIGLQFSASSLELYAGCPFRYLGEAVWKQEEFVAMADEVQPADEGSLLHAVLARFLEPHLHEKLGAEELAELQDELELVFADVCEEFIKNGRVVDSALWQAEKPRLLALLKRWLAFEYADQSVWQGFTPEAVEWDFSSKNGKPLELALTQGKKVRLIGRIDRIDSDGERVFVTDYKRSFAPSGSAVQQGLDLQLPLYLLAAASMYAGGRQAAGGCYFVLKYGERSSIQLFGSVGHSAMETKHKRSRIAKLPWDSFKEFCENLIRTYIEKIYAGEFKVEPKVCDKYCQLSGICRLQELDITVADEGSDDDE